MGELNFIRARSKLISAKSDLLNNVLPYYIPNWIRGKIDMAYRNIQEAQNILDVIILTSKIKDVSVEAVIKSLHDKARTCPECGISILDPEQLRCDCGFEIWVDPKILEGGFKNEC